MANLAPDLEVLRKELWFFAFLVLAVNSIGRE